MIVFSTRSIRPDGDGSPPRSRRWSAITGQKRPIRIIDKNPWGYCGLGGTGVAYPVKASDTVSTKKQLLVFTQPGAPPATDSNSTFSLTGKRRYQLPPSKAWSYHRVSPCITLFRLLRPSFCWSATRSFSRFTGYDGNSVIFWRWLGERLLTPEQQRIAFEQGTERPFTGLHLSEKRAGTFLDPITGAPLFRADAKFESGCGWPSFSNR